jgi:pimeloyl-ACP methyl ester carboxylesterase
MPVATVNGIRAQQGIDSAANRLEEYRKISTDCLVVGFADDLIIPPYLCRELSDHIPGCRYVELDGCGHYGHLERPDAVNALLLDFFA